MSEPGGWPPLPHLPLDQTCPECGFQLFVVHLSKMVLCSNPACEAEPKFLVPKEDDSA